MGDVIRYVSKSFIRSGPSSFGRPSGIVEIAEAFFVSGRGKAYGTGYVQAMFRDVAVQAGLRGPKGRGPRLPLLSTYLGHACVSDTEVYLHITTALLQEADTCFHAFGSLTSNPL